MSEPNREFLDARAFAALLNLNRESVYKAISRGDLVAIRIGRALRLPTSQIDALLSCGDRRETE